MTINYVRGDATRPIGEGKRVIVHCCNDSGGWGSGFVVAISKRWAEPEREYRRWHAEMKDVGGLVLGNSQMVLVEPDLWVANLIGQKGYGDRSSPAYPYVRYSAFKEGFQNLAGWCVINRATVHMPRMGCGLAGGTWERVEPLLWDTFGASDVEVFVYDP